MEIRDHQPSPKLRQTSGLRLQKDGDNRSWMVRVRSGGTLAVGRINGQVLLHFSTGTVTVPIIGEVKPIIQATPATLHFSSGSPKEVERLVMLRSGDGRAFEVLSGTLENADGKVETSKLADGKWQVKLTIRPDSIKPGASVVLKTSIAAQEIIAIPVQIR